MIKVEKFVLSMVSTNCYVLINEELKEAVVVDPGDGPDYFVEYFEKEGLDLKGVLLTHGHFDHIGGVEALVTRYQTPVYAMTEEVPLLAEPRLNASNSIGKAMSVQNVTALSDGEKLVIAGMEIQVIATPGHTAGGCCYYVEALGKLFSGDTLFQGSVGRSDLPTGSHGTLIRSIREKLLDLPEDTIVYPGHMSESTIEYEKGNNPYL